MAINLKSIFTKKNILFIISVVLNILGGTGQIDPIVGGPAATVVAPAGE